MTVQARFRRSWARQAAGFSGRVALIGAAIAMGACGALRMDMILPDGMAAGLKAAGSQLPVGTEEEIAYGGAVAIHIVQRYGGLDRTPELVEYVNLVGEALAIHSARPELSFHFAILNTDEVNALSAPGGYVFITRGTLRACQTESELAGILAHEIAHITARHAIKALQDLKSKEAVADATGWKSSEVFGRLVDGFLDGFLTKGHPEADEREADRVGTGLVARVGWDAGGLRDALRRVAERRAAAPTDRFYGTHPDTIDRMNRIAALLPSYKDRDGLTLELRFRQRVAALTTPK